MREFFMINAMKYIRNFVFVMVCLQSPFAVAMQMSLSDRKMPFPTVPARQSGKSSPASTTSIMAKVFAPFLLSLSPAVDRLSHITIPEVDWQQCKSSIEENVRNNPVSYGALAAVCGGMACYYGMGEKRRVQMKEIFAPYIEKCSNGVDAITPNFLRVFLAGLKALILQPVANFTADYIAYNKVYGVASAVSFGLGPITGYNRFFTFLAAALGLTGLNQVGFNKLGAQIDKLDAKVDKLHDATIAKINEVKDQIMTLGETVEQRIEGVSAQVTTVQTTVQEIQGGIALLKGELEKANINNQTATNLLQTQITELEKSLKENLETRLQVLSVELGKEMTLINENNKGNLHVLQKDLNSMVGLVNEHQLANVQELKDVKGLFIQKFEDLDETLSEYMVEFQQFRVEASSNKEQMLQEIKGVSNELNQLNSQVAEIKVQSEKIEGVTLTLGKIFDETTNMATVIGVLEERSKVLENASDQHNQNTITLTTSVEGLKIQLSKVEDSLHERLQSLVGNIEDLKRNQAEMKSEQTKHGEDIKNINFTVIETKTTLHEQNCLLLDRLAKFEQEQKNLTQIIFNQSKKIEDLNSSQNAIINGQDEISQKIKNFASQGDQRLDRIENGISNLAGQMQDGRIEYNNRKNNSSTVNQIQYLLEHNS